MDKCADCGFLCLLDVEYGNYEGADYSYRTKGSQGGYLTRGFACEPHCSVYAEDLYHEPFVLDDERIQFTEKPHSNLFANERGEDVTTKAVLHIISLPRDCADFFPWRQGFTPKEHSEMSDRQWQIDREDRRDREDKEWRDRQRKEDLDWRQTQETKASSRHRNELWVVGGAVTLALIIGSIVAAIVERGYFWPLWKFTQ